MSAQFNYFFRVDLTVASYLDGSKTYSFTNKTLKDSASLTSYWPILRDIGEVSFVAGEVLPTLSLSSITVDNTRGSFGAARRFQDVLDRYTAVDQTLTVYFAQVANESDAVSSWATVATGKVAGWSSSLRGAEQTLTFDVQPFKFDDRILTLEVSRTVPGMENAPDSSLGRVVPLLIGDDLETVPIRITADGGSSATYVISTVYQDLLSHQYFGEFYFPEVLTKRDDGGWEACSFNFLTAFWGTAGTHTLNTYEARAFGIGETGKSGVCVGVELLCKGNGTGSTSSAKLTVFLLEYDTSTFQVIREVGAGTVDLSLYDASNNAGTSSFSVKVSFDRPVVLSADYGYAIGWSVSGFTSDDLSIHYIPTSTATAPEFRRDSRDPAASSGFDWRYRAAGTGGSPLRAVLRMLVVTEQGTQLAAANQQGLSASYFTLGPSSPAGTGQVDPPLDNLQVTLRDVRGLTDSNLLSPTIISDPVTLTSLLSYRWNNATESWDDTASWDTTTLDATHYDKLYGGSNGTYRSRVARGVIDQKVTFSQLVSEVARGTASKVGLFPSGKAFLYPFGATVTPATHVPPADVSALAWEARDSSGVVNRAILNLGKRYVISDADALENAAGYVYSTDFSAVNFAQVAGVTAESRSVYGNRDLAPTYFPVYPCPSEAVASSATYMGDADSFGSVLAEYYFARFGRPPTYCSFIVPWHRYSALRMFDVITFASADFPAYHGTDPDARPGVVDDSGTVEAVPGANYGEDLVRARTYRGLVEGISYIMSMEHAPAIRLVVLVLLNPEHDPT